MMAPIKKRPIDTFYEEVIDTKDYWSEPLSEEQIDTINILHKAMDDYIMKLEMNEYIIKLIYDIKDQV